MPKIHYVVKYYSKVPGSIVEADQKVIEEKVFIDESPILARKEAISFAENYGHAVQMGRRLNLAHPPKQKEQLRKPEMISDDLWEKLQNLDLNLDNKYMLKGMPAIFLVKEASLLKQDDDLIEIPIYYDVDVRDGEDISNLMRFQEEEFKIYEEYGFDLADQSYVVGFWDSEVFYNDTENDLVFDRHKILRTPFDWRPYEEPNWWNEPDFDELLMESHLIPKNYMEIINGFLPNLDIVVRKNKRFKKSHAERIKQGEGIKVEFKPELFGKSYDNQRDFEFEAAKTINAFLNSYGGYLYIGISDKGDIMKGVNLKGKSEDQYSNAFTGITTRYFDRGIMDDRIKGMFVTIDNKRIFVIKVLPSFKPIFLKDKNDGQVRFRFFNRREVSSRELYDPKSIVDYVESHFWRRK